MSEPRWIQAGFTSREGADTLLTAVVGPLVAELGHDWYFRRGEGDEAQVLLHVRVLGRRDEDDVRRLVRSRAETPVRFAPDDGELRRYGDGAALAAIERHLVESSGIALDLLAPGRSAGERHTAAFCLILSAWLAGTHGVRELDRAIDKGGAPGFGADGSEERYLRRRSTLDRIASRVRPLASAADGAVGSTGPVARWAASVTALRAALADEAAAGRFTPSARGWRGPYGIAGVRNVLTEVDRCAHLICNRIGVPAEHEARVRHQAARTVQEMARSAVH
ncbi:lantibiotic dehydratase C-terminal domain-containing protein [Streptomyces sp. NBC_01217]|uniref:lantibiotic dehydratase C-terminal domain-containing protein n=1 Tax=Streptomyces sp. NBC_01217 TaxID=2903779 RepID=UPI002E146D1C|nr:hypothetical protein OG507_03610 [Streptomyces sp. NBC_01217]